MVTNDDKTEDNYMSKKALVLSSGGVDSTTCVGIAVNELGAENVSTVSVYYGQKHDKELRCADDVANFYSVKHYLIDLASILKYSNCSLLASSTENIPMMSYAEQIKENGEGKVSTYVPFRNGLMLAAVATLAQSIYPDDDVDIYLGAHADDAAGRAYADCSEEFTSAINTAIIIGTYGKVRVVAPLVNLNKSEVVKLGLSIDVPYELTWSCYVGGDKPCGKCGTCIDRRNAFEANGISDPAMED